MESTVEPGPKRLNDATVLTDHKLPEAAEIFVESALMSLSKAKWQVCQVFATRYPAHLEESPEAAREKMASIYVLESDLACEAD